MDPAAALRGARPGRFRAARRALLRFAWAAPLTLSLSCADVPTAPRAMVTVGGQILDRDGGAVTEATVRFAPRDSLAGSPRNGYTARSDGAGRYRILAPAARYDVRVDPELGSGLLSATIADVAVGPGPTTVDYRYQGYRVSGRILGPAGVARSIIVSASSGQTYEFTYFGPTSDNYSFLLPPGPWSMEAFPLSGNSGLRRVSFDLPNVTADTTIDVDLNGYAVDVSVTRQGTIPITGVQVSALSTAARADVQTGLLGVGRVYLPAGWYSFSTRPTANIVGIDAVTREITANATVSLDLPGVVWSGVLRRTSDASPIANQPLTLSSPAAPGSWTTYGGTDASGVFQFVVYPGRPYDFRTYLPLPAYQVLPVVVASGVTSSADSTFDLYVDAPAP